MSKVSSEATMSDTTERIIRGRFYTDDRDRLFVVEYFRYRAFAQRISNFSNHEMRFSEMNREDSEYSVEDVLLYIESCRLGRIPNIFPSMPRGYWLLRWLEIQHTIFPNREIAITSLDRRLIGEAYGKFCAERSYIHAALVIRVASRLKIKFARSKLDASKEEYIALLTLKVT